MVQSHLPPFRNLGNFVHPTFACVFRKKHQKLVVPSSGVYARGSKRFHTGGKCVTCNGLTNSCWALNARPVCERKRKVIVFRCVRGCNSVFATHRLHKPAGRGHIR